MIHYSHQDCGTELLLVDADTGRLRSYTLGESPSCLLTMPLYPHNCHSDIYMQVGYAWSFGMCLPRVLEQLSWHQLPGASLVQGWSPDL